MSGLSEWFWTGILSLPFAIVGNLFYDMLVKGAKIDSRLNRLNRPLHHDEAGMFIQGLVYVYGGLFFLTFLLPRYMSGTLGIPTIGAASETRSSAQVIGDLIAMFMASGTVATLVGLFSLPALLLGLRRRVDFLIFFVLAMGVSAILAARVMLDPRPFGVEIFGMVMLAGLVAASVGVAASRLLISLVSLVAGWFLRD